MATPETKLRIFDETNEALKQVVAVFPEWSLAQLGNKLLVESCNAILGESAAFPTAEYIRGQIALRAQRDRITHAAAVHSITKERAKKNQAARGKAA